MGASRIRSDFAPVCPCPVRRRPSSRWSALPPGISTSRIPRIGGSARATPSRGRTPSPAANAQPKTALMPFGVGSREACAQAGRGPARFRANVRRSYLGPPPCTVTNGCFKKLAQDGSNKCRLANGSWAEVTSLNLDFASVICTTSDIHLARGNSRSILNPGTAVYEAASLSDTASLTSDRGSKSTTETTHAQYSRYRASRPQPRRPNERYSTQYIASSQCVKTGGGRR